jgi:uncharacterized protein YecE (DUF72 family)
MAIYIGTSGWHYLHWKGIFYPDRLPASQMFGYYSRIFNSVEVNNSFYGLPSEKTVLTWGSSAPQGFRFSIKASKSITHINRLRNVAADLMLLLKRVSLLGGALGPILFQLPPGFPPDLPILNSFLASLPPGYHFTIEFRDPAWFQPEVFNALERAGVAFCAYDFDRRQSPRVVTANFVYTRLHGPDGPYSGQYNPEVLENWGKFFQENIREGRDIYCYFDNTQANFAPEDALRLRSILSE